MRIGEWGRDLDYGTAWRALRQNARLVIADGVTSSAIYSDALSDWGGTINGETVTWRSAAGLSADGQTLYYLAGPGLSMPALAAALTALGAHNAMLLDINAYWVHFAAITPDANGRPTAAPLLPEMDTHIDRHLRPSERDFFYVTAGS